MLFLLVAVPLLGAIVLFWLLGRVAAAAALLLALLYANVSDIGIRYHGWPSVAQPLVLLFAGAAFARRVRAGTARPFDCTGFWVAAAVYLAVVVASSIWAVDQGAASHQAANLAKALLIVYVIAELFDTAKRQRLAIWALIGGGAALAAISVVQAVTHTYDNSYLGLAQAQVRQLVGTTNGYRSAGPIGDPNVFGLTLAALVPFAVLRWWDEKRLSLRAAGLVSTVLLVAGVALTYSRGALIALAVAAAGLAATIRLPVRKPLLLGGLVLVSLAAITPTQYVHRLTSLGQANHSLRGRLDSEYVAVTMFADHPLLGVGADNYQARYVPYSEQLHAVDAASSVHDLYLAVASETGLVGFLAFGGAIFVVFRRSWRQRADSLRVGDQVAARLATASSLALATYLTGCLFIPLVYPRYLWIFVGVALSISLPSNTAESVTAGREHSAVPA